MAQAMLAKLSELSNRDMLRGKAALLDRTAALDHYVEVFNSEIPPKPSPKLSIAAADRDV